MASWSSRAVLFFLAFLVSAKTLAITVTVKNGEPVRMTFSDGREAVMKVSNFLFSNYRIPFAVTETLCSDHQNLRCSFVLTGKSQRYYFVWSKNSDVSKIGQEITTGATENNSPAISQSITMIGPETAYAPKAAAGVQALQMECDDFSWLPEGQKKAPATLRAVRWETEIMLANSETGAAENRSLSGAYNLAFARTSDKALKLTGMGSVVSDISGFTNLQMVFLFGNPTIAVVLDDNKGDTCQATLQTDSSALRSQSSGVQTSILKPDEVYIVGSDEILSLPRLFDFSTFLNGLPRTLEKDYK